MYETTLTDGYLDIWMDWTNLLMVARLVSWPKEEVRMEFQLIPNRTFLTEGISNCFIPQTPVIFAWYFVTRMMLLTARRPHERELADSD